MTDPVRKAAVFVVARAYDADPWWQVTNPAVAKLRAAIIALAETLVENPPPARDAGEATGE